MKKKISTTLAIIIILIVAAIAVATIVSFTRCEDERALIEMISI